MKKFTYFALFLVVFSALVIIIGCTVYNINIGPVSNNSELKNVEIETGNSFSTIAPILKENNLIKSEFFYKVYIKIFKPKSLEACHYNLSESMSVKELITALEKGCNNNPGALKLTIPEGRHLEQIAEIVATKTNNTKENLMKVWNSPKFVDEVIAKYEFATNEIKNKSIRYSLEGYFFPSTYELQNKDATPEYIAYKMLDQMNVIYNKYKADIAKSEYTFHEIITMASIVEYEAILDEDRPIIAGVFYNRLDYNWKFGSCATIGYAIGEWKLSYSYADMAVDSPYNTYLYAGLPAGPGGMPSEKSIEAAIYPADTDYFYFLANVCDPNNKKTYFSKTDTEHQIKIDKYLGCLND